MAVEARDLLTLDTARPACPDRRVATRGSRIATRWQAAIPVAAGDIRDFARGTDHADARLAARPMPHGPPGPRRSPLKHATSSTSRAGRDMLEPAEASPRAGYAPGIGGPRRSPLKLSTSSTSHPLRTERGAASHAGRRSERPHDRFTPSRRNALKSVGKVGHAGRSCGSLHPQRRSVHPARDATRGRSQHPQLRRLNEACASRPAGYRSRPAAPQRSLLKPSTFSTSQR